MSLCCHETGRDLEAGERIWAGTRLENPEYSAVCDEIVTDIPVSERRSIPCELGDGGIDIHHLSSSPGLTGRSYQLSFSKLGKFAFSVSKETAMKRLPKLYKKYVLDPWN